MKNVKEGLIVKVQYTGRLESGEIFDSSQEDHPLEFEVGSGQMIKGFEEAIAGMAPGQETSFSLPPDKAYGYRNEGLIKRLLRADLPDNFDARRGDIVALDLGEHRLTPVTVQYIKGDSVTLDLNHPLCGETLYFDVKVLEVSQPWKSDG